MTGLKKLIGLPVVLDGRVSGSVLRCVVTLDGRELRGIVVRGGLKGARWLPREQLQLLGRVSVIGSGLLQKLPKDSTWHLFRVSDADGARLGIVTDALLHEESMLVQALEISSGPVDDLISGRFYATAFDVRPSGDTGHVTIPCLREEVKVE